LEKRETTYLSQESNLDPKVELYPQEINLMAKYHMKRNRQTLKTIHILDVIQDVWEQ
jgi:hypothetical protein